MKRFAMHTKVLHYIGLPHRSWKTFVFAYHMYTCRNVITIRRRLWTWIIIHGEPKQLDRPTPQAGVHLFQWLNTDPTFICIRITQIPDHPSSPWSIHRKITTILKWSVRESLMLDDRLTYETWLTASPEGIRCSISPPPVRTRRDTLWWNTAETSTIPLYHHG